ncbi:MAG: NfeD family protein [Methylomicrobium sp.]
MFGFDIIFWHWWVFALLCLVIEILAPGFFFIWLALSAIVTGVLLWIVPSLSQEVQLMIFSLLSIVSFVIWKMFFSKTTTVTDKPLLNKRGDQYVGRVFTLIEAIENGQGKIKVDDSIWKVHGEDCAVNAKVKVVGVRGTVFDVEKVG